MGLNFAAGCVNFRDVGACVNLLAERAVLPEGRLLRGGKLDAVTTAEQIGVPGTILNVRRGPDSLAQRFGADSWHFPISNEYEKYHTTDPIVRRWLNDLPALRAKLGWPAIPANAG
jgi:protein-tyrosine phosphatase